MIALPTVCQVFDGSCLGERLETRCPQSPQGTWVLLLQYRWKDYALSFRIFVYLMTPWQLKVLHGVERATW